ncbi:MAG TPA: AMP-binding protein [Solirubrobacterales bacterium]|nr:AMP-binding protein [Solirubrobacterales bacterium]
MSAALSPEAAERPWRRHLGALWKDFVPSELARGSLPQAFAFAAEAAPDRPAVTIGGAAVTHGQLDDDAARIGGWLLERGVGRGSRVLLAGPTSHPFVRAYLGVLRSGATAMPVEAGLKAPELERIISVAPPNAAFVSNDAAAELARVGKASKLVVGLEPGACSLELSEAQSGPPAEPAGPGSPAILAFTSGTTGEPKGVPLSHGNVLSSIRAAMLAWRWAADDVMLHALPLSHQHGLSGLHATLIAGSAAVIQPRFDAASFAALGRNDAASIILAVPAMYERLLELPAADLSLPALRLAVSGSAPLPGRLAEQVGDRLGQLPLERYGSTEAGLVLSNLYEGPRRPGRVGYPLPGIEVRLAGSDAGEADPGSPGEILVRGQQVFEGYWQRPDATTEAFDDDGWFRSGDIGTVDAADGSYAVTGRSKDLIITGGLNVSPGEVEEVIDRHPGVVRSAVAGVPSQRWGEEVTAFVVLAADKAPDADELVGHCRGRLSAYKCPKRVVVVDEIPTNEMGKVLRDRLVPLADDARDTRIDKEE